MYHTVSENVHKVPTIARNLFLLVATTATRAEVNMTSNKLQSNIRKANSADISLGIIKWPRRRSYRKLVIFIFNSRDHQALYRNNNCGNVSVIWLRAYLRRQRDTLFIYLRDMKYIISAPPLYIFLKPSPVSCNGNHRSISRKYINVRH